MFSCRIKFVSADLETVGTAFGFGDDLITAQQNVQKIVPTVREKIAENGGRGLEFTEMCRDDKKVRNHIVRTEYTYTIRPAHDLLP